MLESLCIADKDFDTTAWAHNENWIFEYSTEHIIDHAQRWLSLKSLKDHTALTDKRIFRYWTLVLRWWRCGAVSVIICIACRWKKALIAIGHCDGSLNEDETLYLVTMIFEYVNIFRKCLPFYAILFGY